MNDLHSEIRAAFEKEQAKHPPLPSLRRTVFGAAMIRPHRETRLQWLAVAAAVLLGLLVVAGLVSSRMNRASIPSHETPVADYGPPPAGVSLIYAADPHHQGWYIGFDWSGKPRGTVKIAKRPDRSQALYQAADGSGFRLTDRTSDYDPAAGFSDRFGYATGDYFDRLGSSVPGDLPAARVPGIWADDNMHICLEFIEPETGYPTLATKLPGQPSRIVMAIPQGRAQLLESTVRVVSCSFKNDRAVLVRRLFHRPTHLWVVRLSDGKVLADHIYPSEQFDSMVASNDGQYIAENGRHLNGIQITDTQIRRVSDWTVVARWTGRAEVVAFSADSSLVTLSAWIYLPGVEVLDWRSGSVVWRHAGPEVLVGFLAEPSGRNIALALAAPVTVGPSPCSDHPGTTCIPPVFYSKSYDIIIIHPDASTTQIPRRYATVW
jgi:hypothetical protein